MRNLLIFSIILPAFVTAQKSVDLDKFRFRVQFRSLPAVKIDSTYRTYDVSLESTRMMAPFLKEMTPEKTVRLEGWRQLEKSGHLSVHVRLGDLLPGDASVKERVVTKKNGNGQVVGTTTYYYQEVVYTFEADATIDDYHGAHIQDILLSARDYKRVYRSPEFTFRKLAEGYFILNSLKVTEDLYRQCVTQCMHNLSNQLTTNYGYDEVTVNDYMWVIGSRKHPEYKEWRRAFQQLNEILFGMTATRPLNGAREKLEPVIKYFEKIRNEYPSTSRHDRKIRYATYYNLAVMYYYLDDPEAMMREANGLILNDFDTNDGKAFAKTATWLRNIFDQTNIYTRHFKIDINELKGPYETNNTAAASVK